MNYNIKLLCKCLNVPRSVYYYHQIHKTNSYYEANKILDEEILAAYKESKNRYVSPKITKALNCRNIKVSQKRVARRMHMLGIKSITVKKFKPLASNQLFVQKNIKTS